MADTFFDNNIDCVESFSLGSPNKQKCGDNSFSGVLNINHENCILLILADGVSGAPKDWLASKTVVESVLEYFSENQFPFEQLMRNAVNNADKILISGVDGTTGMLSTLSILVYRPEIKKVYYANVGDARIYGIKNGIFTVLTNDDTSSEVVKQNGKLRIVNGVPSFKSHLTKAIGGYQELDIQVSVTISSEYSAFALVSDGFYNLFLFQECVKRIMSSVDVRREIQKIKNDIKEDIDDDASIAILVLNSADDLDVKEIIINKTESNNLSGKVLLKPVMDELNSAIDSGDNDYLESILNFMNRNEIVDSKETMILLLEKMIAKNTDHQEVMKMMIRKVY
ncbi:MAG: protein phosphatase 2C domain-containing protein [Ignavibacteria bacterium]|nr:protein phosphatase 2C domain-containing protein [Ignavibacteria bacterium]